MGNKKSKKEPTIYDRIESFLFKSFKNTGLEFTENEIINFKLRILDAERYFNSNFDYYIFFNNFLFKDQLTTLYENFNQTIEIANKTPEKPMCILIDFDDETEYIIQGASLEFDSLFTIIFEKLEIPVIIYFDMTNTDSIYMFDFFKQIIENVELYKYNRKFDCLYFLLPNTDYFCKNENALYYISNKAFNEDEEISEEIFDVPNEYSDSIFLHEDIEKFINCNYLQNISNKRFEIMVKRIKPKFTKMFICFNFDLDFEFLYSKNSENLEKINFLLNNSERNILVINFCYSLNCNNVNNFEEIIVENISFIIKQICFIFFKVKSLQSILGIKINLKIKDEEEIANLNKLSSRNYDYLNNPLISSKREMRSKREKEKIQNYFYDSQYNNIFEFLAFDISSIFNNYFEFPLTDEDNKFKKDGTSQNELYGSTCSKITYNNSKDKNQKDLNVKNNNKNKLNNFPSEIIDYENMKYPNDFNDPLSFNNNKKKNLKKQKFYKKLNIEFNEISPVNNENMEIVKVLPNEKEEKEEQKVINLDHNLHSEKLLIFVDDPSKKSEKEVELIKKRNREFNNFRNILNNSNKFSALKEWNILMTLQNMFIDDVANKSYKIEKSNINYTDYLQKIH